MGGDASDFTNAIQEINENVSNIFGSTMTPDQLIGYQQDVNEYIDNETNRLLKKQDAVNSAKYSQMRAVELNDNYRKRTSAFNYIIIVTCLVIFGVLVLNLVKSLVTFIPGFIFDLLSAVLITFVIIYDILMYQQITLRSSTDFDKLNVNPPTVTTSDPATTTTLAPSGASAPSSSTCQGAACCDTSAGMTYDERVNRCVSSISGFTLMDNEEHHEEQPNYEPQPHTPFEFSKYILYSQL